MNSNKRPYLILQPSVNTTTVVTTTTTTTNYAPIPLPQLPQQTSSVSSTNFDKNIYPLQNTRIPQSLRSFPIVFPGGARATFRDDDHNLPDDPPDNPSGVGWRMVPRESDSDHNNIHISLPDALDRFAKKRSLNSDILMEGVEPNRKRQRPAAPPSPLPSPRGSPSPTTDEFPLQPDLSLTTLLTLPSLLSHFIALPPQLQSHFLLTLLRHSPLPVLRTLHSVLTPTLARDFLTLLPPELVSHVLSFLPFSTLARASRVSKPWRAIIDSDPVLWRDLLKSTKIWFGGDSERAFARSIYAQRARIPPHQLPSLPLPHPYKTLFKSRHLTRTRWVHNQNPKHTSFPAHGSSVVTCLLFSHGRIISASDDYSIHAYSPLTGQLLRSFDGHEGGVWALAASNDTLVSGSTDRTVRIWNLSTGRCTHVFGGHTSTVRCLAIVKPEVVDVERDSGVFVREKWPKRPLIVTGSRDHSLRVWTLPRRGDPEYRSFPSAGDEAEGGVGEDVDDNPYHKLHLEGHDQAVRALAARGRILVSGSYDCTVRIWDIITGECKWILTGHSQKGTLLTFDS
jgi:F-box and WD-40 domain protein CDC4